MTRATEERNLRWVKLYTEGLCNPDKAQGLSSCSFLRQTYWGHMLPTISSCSFLIAMKSHNRLRSLKQHDLIIFEFWRSEIQKWIFWDSLSSRACTTENLPGPFQLPLTHWPSQQGLPWPSSLNNTYLFRAPSLFPLLRPCDDILGLSLLLVSSAFVHLNNPSLGYWDSVMNLFKRKWVLASCKTIRKMILKKLKTRPER